MCMVDEGDGWLVFRDEHRVARKQHKCYECGRDIEAGERYYFATGVLNGDRKWITMRQCAHCVWAAAWLRSECNGFLFGCVEEDLRDHWDGELMRGLDLGRRIVGMRRRWKRRDGSLMPVPA